MRRKSFWLDGGVGVFSKHFHHAAQKTYWKKLPTDKPIELDSVRTEEVIPQGIDAVRAVLKRSIDFKRVASIPFETAGLTVLFFRDWETAHHAFVVDLSTKWNVYPALQVRLERGAWQVQPWVLTAPDVARSLGIPIDEPWLKVMLGLVTLELDPLLPDPTIVYTNELVDRPDGPTEADYPPLQLALLRIGEFISGGFKSFFSDQRAQRKWFIASRWPVWMAGDFSQGKAASEVAVVDGVKQYPSDNLRSACREMGLIWPHRSTW